MRTKKFGNENRCWSLERAYCTVGIYTLPPLWAVRQTPSSSLLVFYLTPYTFFFETLNFDAFLPPFNKIRKDGKSLFVLQETQLLYSTLFWKAHITAQRMEFHICCSFNAHWLYDSASIWIMWYRLPVYCGITGCSVDYAAYCSTNVLDFILLLHLILLCFSKLSKLCGSEFFLFIHQTM